VPRTVSVEEFVAGASSLLDEVSAGDSILVLRGDAPVAVLTGSAASRGLGTLGDLPRWEQWLDAMRESFPEATGRTSTARIALPEPPTVDKSLLGFDPTAGSLGSASGRDHLSRELSRLNVPVRDDSLLGELYAEVLALCEEKERVYEDDLRVLAQGTLARAPRRLRLLSMTVSSTTGLPATAEVTLELGQGPAMRREQGDGPLDAAFKAIQRLAQVEPRVENFSVVAATPGQDAMAEAVIGLVNAGITVVGTGVSTNAIEAGVIAYINALNFLLEESPSR
jgi:antitoxin (DNA-binding transcriptional repressor) of toxin-antitoxin stability system